MARRISFILRVSSGKHFGLGILLKVEISGPHGLIIALFWQEEKRRSAGPNTEIAKGGVSTTERDIHRVENRLQQVGRDVSQACIPL